MTRDEIKQCLAMGHPVDQLTDGRWVLAGSDVIVPIEMISEPWEGVWIVTTTPTFKRDNIEFLQSAPTYLKRTLTRVQRIDGRFEVLTKEGWLRCEDGYLTMDAEGWPYPIAKEIFEKTYVRIGLEDGEDIRELLLSKLKTDLLDAIQCIDTLRIPKDSKTKEA